MAERSKATQFQQLTDVIQAWLLEGYTIESITEMLKDQHGLEITVYTMNSYIRRFWKKGVREVRKEYFSHEKNIPPQDRRLGKHENPVQPGLEKPVSEGDASKVVNDALNAKDRGQAVGKYFDRSSRYKGNKE